MPKSKKTKHTRVCMEGFVRLQIMNYDKDGKPTIVAADSGWQGPNQMTNVGFMNYINYVLGSSSGSLRVAYAAIGTGSAGSNPASSDTSLPGEYGGSTGYRKSVTFAAVNSTKIRFTASWASTDQSSSGNFTVQNAGLYDTTNANSLMCGKSFATSTWGSNQALNLSYELNLSAT